MVTLKSRSGISAGNIFKEFVSVSVAHPQQTTGTVEYTINHNLDLLDGGPDLIVCYEGTEGSGNWRQMEEIHYADTAGGGGWVWGSSVSSFFDRNTSKVNVGRKAWGYPDIQFRIYKFNTDTIQ